MICPHGNEAPSAPWEDCAQCEAAAERRELDLLQLEAEAEHAAEVIDLERITQPRLPDELLPKPAGALFLP